MRCRPVGIGPLGDELVALFVDAGLEALDERRALFGSHRRENRARAHEVLHHAPATVTRELHGDIGLALGNRIERVLATDQENAGAAGDHAGRARRARQRATSLRRARHR